MEPDRTWPEPPPPLPPEPPGPEVVDERYARPSAPLYGAYPHEVVEQHYQARYTTPASAPLMPVAPVVGAAPSAEAARERRIYRAIRVRQIVYMILGILETLLVIRFALKLLAANPDASFTSFIYALTEPFTLPFQDVFPSPGTRGSVLDLAAVLAMIIYALLAWAIVSVVYTLANRQPTTSA